MSDGDDHGDRRRWPATPSSDDPLRTRASLLERLKDLDDHASWREFYESYYHLIYSVARRSGLSEQEAEEAVQETLISVARKMPGFTYDPARDSFKGWLLTVTRWRVRDQWQKRRKATLLQGQDSAAGEPRTEEVPDPAGSALEAIWEDEWEKHLLRAALARVKRQVAPQQYEIYYLYVVLGQPVADVKNALGVSAAQIYLAKHRVGACLKKSLKQLRASHNEP